MLPNFIETNQINAQILTFDEEVSTCKDVFKLENSIPSILLCKSILFSYSNEKGKEYAMVILEGKKKVNWDKLKTILHASSARLATPEEVLETTGYEVGEVPPISIFGTKTYIDQGVLEHAWVLCGGGSKHTLLKIQTKDLLEHAFEPEIVNVAE